MPWSKRFLWMAGISVMVVGAAPAGATPRVRVDGKIVRGAPVMVIGGHAMVPVRGVIQRIPGARVHWDAPHKRIIVTRGKQRVRLHLYSGYAHLDHEAVPLDVPVVMRDNQALMPLRFVSEFLGAQVSYHPERRLVDIRSGQPGTQVAGYRSRSVASSVPGRVDIGGITLVTLPTPGEHSSVERRAAEVTDRLTEATPALFERGEFNLHRLWLGSAGGDPVICIGNPAVVRVTQKDAEALGVPQDQVARTWLAQMRDGLRRVYGRR